MEQANTDIAAGLTRGSVGHLNTIRKWLLFFSILGFAVCGLMILGGLAFGAIMEWIGPPAEFLPGIIVGIIYCGLGLLFLLPSFFLLRSATALRRGIQGQNAAETEEGLKFLKYFLTFVGVYEIVGLGFAALFLIVMVLGLLFAL